jgi:hypothetical protein
MPVKILPFATRCFLPSTLRPKPSGDLPAIATAKWRRLDALSNIPEAS